MPTMDHDALAAATRAGTDATPLRLVAGSAWGAQQVDLSDTEAGGDTPIPAPTGAHWGPRPAEPQRVQHLAAGTAAAGCDAGDADWPLDSAVLGAVTNAYARGHADGKLDGLQAGAAREFRRVLWAMLAGFACAMVMVVGGCAVIAALDSGRALQAVPAATTSWSDAA